MTRVLCLNAGSSSVKFAIYEDAAAQAPEGMRLRLSGAAEGLGAAPRLHARDALGAVLFDHDWPKGAAPTHEDVFEELLRRLTDAPGGQDVQAAGHRIVHGGDAFAAPVRLTPEVLSALEAYTPLAPLHQPHNLAAARTLMTMRPDLPQIGCFDTAFHAGQEPLVRRYALPEALWASGIKRYGFHGLSYEYVARRLTEAGGPCARGKVIVAHLGAGASLCALKEGRSVDTTMGMTALDGLMMGTRPGSLDPGVVLTLVKDRGWDPAAVEDLFYNRSGLLGVSGLTGDMRTLLGSAEPAARTAVDLFVLQAVRQIGALTAVLGGLDGLVFTAGVGENAPWIRSAICARLAYLGVVLDPAANAAGSAVISARKSAVEVQVVRTNEQLMIATHVVETLGAAF